MKADILDKTGKGIKKIDLPKVFDTRIREDVMHRAYIVGLKKQPFGAYKLAGMEVSAQGKQSHRRNKYKTLYGKGISRIPRKTMSRRGDQFYWVGAYVPGTVGGRKAHAPKVLARVLKINKKEKKLAIQSAIAATASKEFINKKYPKLNLKLNPPFIIDSVLLKEKNKDIVNALSEIMGFEIKRTKKIRAGKGKMRGRKYKKQTKVLLVTSEKEIGKRLGNYGLDLSTAKNLNVGILATGGVPGRLTVYTSEAIGELK
ncbi:MAG: 50S ribosomal protein L4 [archaeon]